jgi:hypothetical protein
MLSYLDVSVSFENPQNRQDTPVSNARNVNPISLSIELKEIKF